MVKSLIPDRACVTLGCRKFAVARRRRCHRCIKARWREAHPIEAQYARLKAKAKQRRIPFSLTIEDFREFCQATGYAERVGCGEPADLQCDRIDARQGYCRGNIQALAFLDNARKGAAERAGGTLCVGPACAPELMPF